jgi:ribosomal protein S12 methylthiotransferase
MGRNNKQKLVSVAFVALGCPKNMVDSEKMLATIGESGFIISADVDNADVVVINTCGFIQPAKEEAIDAIKTAIRLKKKHKIQKVIVAGCLSQRMGQSLAEVAKGIDAIVGLGTRERIGEIISTTLSADKHQAPLTFLDGAEGISDDRGRLLITPMHWAYLRISEGCNRKCSFCTIPSIRGRFRSKPPDLVLSEAEELVKNGAVELNIIAQDSTSYGKDLGLKDGLLKLIKELEKIERLKWIRLMYLYPSGIDEKLIETIAESQRIVNYIDMPIQHINNDILKDMHRSDTKEKIIDLLKTLRKAIPDVVLRTTIIAGFPGETDEKFAELVEFIKWARFDALGCFPFYAEAGTEAAKMDGQLPNHVKNERVEKVMLSQQKIAFEKNKTRIGQQLTCLLDSAEAKGRAQGRFYGQAPHIDSICYIEKCSANAGQFIDAKVTATRDYDILAVQI